MCGLVISSTPRPDLLEAISHRGVRSSAAHLTKGWVGHTRLPIVGTSEEYDQPVVRGKWVIAFVGELLDFRERHPGMSCDTELVADVWERVGPTGFHRYDGFWSVAALDATNGDIHLLTDYLAQKPLYYRTDLRMAASEPIACALAGPTTPDEIYFSSVIKWGYCPDTRRTPYNEVKKTLPGEWAVLAENKPVDRGIVDHLQPVISTPDDLKVEIERAIKRRVQSSDVPVAALVSGGLDSAIVYTLAKRYGKVRPYHIENGETEEAARVIGSDAHEYRLMKSWTPSLATQLDVMQEPIDLGSLVPQMGLSQEIDETVCLTGDGADEFFSGYGRAERYDSQASDVWHELVAWHLPRLDRVMMRNRIEVRSPFLARKVAAAALGLPYSVRKGKGILRHLFREDLPAGVADTPKRPLRGPTFDREVRSIELVNLFRKRVWA